MNSLVAYLLIPYAVIGWLFICLLIAGLVMNGKQCAIALDQFVGTCTIVGHMADETISAWVHRTHRKRAERFINWLFNDPQHCAHAYVSEMVRTQEPDEYRK